MKGARREKNRLNGFSLEHPWFTALKRGVNEMISKKQLASLCYCSSGFHFGVRVEFRQAAFKIFDPKFQPAVPAFARVRW